MFRAAPLTLALLTLAGCGARTALRLPDVTLPDAALADAPDAIDAVDVPVETLPDAPIDTPRDIARDTPADVRDVADVPDAPPPVDACTGCQCDPFVCNDHDACTVDLCNGDGSCAHTAVRCVDSDPCTTDRCDPAAGCVFDPIDCNTTGCADGTREAYRDQTRYPHIAGCAGGFAIPGVFGDAAPACARGAGNSGSNPNGAGCNSTDLCQGGWHVCRDGDDVRAHSSDGCAGSHDAPGSFFATRMSGPGCGMCSNGSDPSCSDESCHPGCALNRNTTNDVFGCGTVGGTPDGLSCSGLDRFSNNLCGDLPAPWSCPAENRGDEHECEFVRKLGPEAGGILCCQD